MRKWFMGLALLATMGLILSTATAADEKKDEKKVSNKEIMSKSNGKMGLKGAIDKGLKADKIDWDDVGKKAKELAELGAALPKNEAKKGEKDSWEKLAKAWADETKALADAAEKKDKDAATKAAGNLGKSCGGCHKAHK
jgi:cytochrome c556